ncbi:MAG TPA: hypothetical protein VLH56_11290 [Dissulfurispiraceae bacterium]|nr:hypothetical protein [Dissulfurispiraceae bacterium]
MRFIQIILQLKLKEMEEQQKIILDKALKGGPGDHTVIKRSLQDTVPGSWSLGVEAMQRGLKMGAKGVPFPASVNEYISKRVNDSMKRAVGVYNARVFGLKKGPAVDQAFSEYKRSLWQAVRCAIQDAAQWGGRWASGDRDV